MRLARATLLTLTLLVGLAAGCSSRQSRVLDNLPPPVFVEPPYDWPTSAPEVARPLDDIEAGWRNHVLPGRAWRWIVI
ncbi:MAG: hypothetical protein PHU85_06290, partial [Phycisphaerae bacterium]|nr:hypothetical protein [Phycisphaerae bacterium]